MQRLVWSVLVGSTGFAWSMPALAQNVLDRADPAVTQKTLPDPQAPERVTPEVKVAPRPPVAEAGPAIRLPLADAIVVEGGEGLSAASFANVVVGFVGRELTPADLSDLTTRVAAVARRNDYPLATAMIAPQAMADGILRVTLDLGRIDAVRVIGGTNPHADRLLTRALVTGRPIRGRTLERAITLVGDIPGVTVKSNRFMRQEGFGILLVTIAEDRFSAYAQVDNRGSDEVGPVRSTVLGAVRNVLRSGDEIGLLASNTPIQSSEFAFLRARYSAPVDLRGSVVTVAASYGRAHPGAALAGLDVIGHSTDFSVGYAHPIQRSRKASWWGSIELRALKSDQSLLGRPLRDDRLATLTTSAIGAFAVAGGALRSEFRMVAGLPLRGVSRNGDPRISRSDGDARFVTWGYDIDWSARLGRTFGIVVASAGQLASRPLLASQEIGLGGPAFGRAYDNAERTGDQGIVGSFELNANLKPTGRSPIQRVQPFAFVDGGYVSNLRNGFGGGRLASAGGGVRLGSGTTTGLIEVAVPLNADRFDTGDRRARATLRLSRLF